MCAYKSVISGNYAAVRMSDPSFKRRKGKREREIEYGIWRAYRIQSLRIKGSNIFFYRFIPDFRVSYKKAPVRIYGKQGK